MPVTPCPQQRKGNPRRMFSHYIFGLKQFHHYLLGCNLLIMPPYSGSQVRKWKACWLDGHWQLKNMISPLATYRKGSENSNADALSRQTEQRDSHSAAIAMESLAVKELKHHQSQDSVIRQLHDALLHFPTPLNGCTWSQSPLNRYHQLWSQLFIKDGLLCRQYTPGPVSDLLTVPIIPSSHKSTLLHQYHDLPGHLGPDKTATRVILDK